MGCFMDTSRRPHSREGLRSFQLKVMGFIAIFIGPIVLFVTMAIYDLPFPQSISETATIPNKTAPILPFCLGALALFALSYAIVHVYDRMDRILTTGMFVGFTIVALQMCKSPYIDARRVGAFGVTESTSNMLHGVGAVAGFGCMIMWVMLCFTKSDKRKHEHTKEKKLRNNCYFWLGLAMLLSLMLFVVKHIGLLGGGFPVVFTTECFMLTFGGVACLIKGGLFLRDK